MLTTISGSKPADRSKSLFSQFDPLARKSEFIARASSRFSASGFVLALLTAVITGKGSFNQLAMNLGQSEVKSMSRQALWSRVNTRAVSFLLLVVGKALAQRWSTQNAVDSSCFTRILIQDSSQAKLPKCNAKEFPAHGNGTGKTAGCKSDFAFDLLTGEPVLQSLQLATTQDRDLGKDLVDLVSKGDLVLRDMGYFSIDEFGRIAARHAHWLSRVPVSVTLSDEKGDKIEALLRRTKLKKIDMDVFVGTVGFLARLVAVRAPKALAAQRRRDRRKQAKDYGKTPNQDALVRDGWHIMITNIEDEQMEWEKLFSLYAVRWKIEITFRAWKQSAHSVQALKRRSNACHLQVLMLASLLLLILTMKVAALCQCRHRDVPLSIEKIAVSLSTHLLTLSTLQDFCSYNPDPRHISMGKRQRQTLQEIALQALS